MTVMRRLKSDESGAIAIIFALSAFVVIMSIGLAVDGGRAYNVSTRLTAALDSAALAAAKLLHDDSLSDHEIEERAEAFFRAQWKTVPVNGVTVPLLKTVIRRKQSEVTVEGDAIVAATFAQLAGIPQFTVRGAAAVVYKARKVELAMALDVTGSMDGEKIDMLRDAAREAVDTMLAGNPGPGMVRIGIAPYSATVNAGDFANTVSGGVSADNCVFERAGAEAYSETPPTGATTYVGAMANPRRPTNIHYACPAPKLLPMTDDRTVLRDRINELRPGGYTAGHIGLAWGWYLVSPDWAGVWPAASIGKPYTDDDVIKAVIMMTDGEFNTSYRNGSVNSTNPNAVGSSGYQALQLCANMKARGVTIYTVAFQSPPAAQTLLRTCATAATHAFNAADRNELRQAFRTIAERLDSIRLSR